MFPFFSQNPLLIPLRLTGGSLAGPPGVPGRRRRRSDLPVIVTFDVLSTFVIPAYNSLVFVSSRQRLRNSLTTSSAQSTTLLDILRNYLMRHLPAQLVLLQYSRVGIPGNAQSAESEIVAKIDRPPPRITCSCIHLFAIAYDSISNVRKFKFSSVEMLCHSIDRLDSFLSFAFRYTHYFIQPDSFPISFLILHFIRHLSIHFFLFVTPSAATAAAKVTFFSGSFSTQYRCVFHAGRTRRRRAPGLCHPNFFPLPSLFMSPVSLQCMAAAVCVCVCL